MPQVKAASENGTKTVDQHSDFIGYTALDIPQLDLWGINAMPFQQFLKDAGDRLSGTPEMVAKYEYVWNSAIRAAATACQEQADRSGDPAQRQAATLCAESVMELWSSPRLTLG